MKKSLVRHERQPARLSGGQIRAAIPKLERRLAELKSFDPANKVLIKSDTDDAKTLELKIDSTLIDVFGHDTLEYSKYKTHSLYAGSYNLNGTPEHEIIDGYERGKKRAIASLEAAIGTLKESLLDIEVPSGISTPVSLDGCDLHQALQTACGGLYRDRHYAQAIETACKVLNVQIQSRSGIYNQDNTKLMEFVFSAQNPVLAFNNLQDITDKDEQSGLMFIYKGLFLAFRNPRAHKLVDDDPQTAFGIIRTIDFFIKMLDKAKNIN